MMDFKFFFWNERSGNYVYENAFPDGLVCVFFDRKSMTVSGSLLKRISLSAESLKFSVGAVVAVVKGTVKIVC